TTGPPSSVSSSLGAESEGESRSADQIPTARSRSIVPCSSPTSRRRSSSHWGSTPSRYSEHPASRSPNCLPDPQNRELSKMSLVDAVMSDPENSKLEYTSTFENDISQARYWYRSAKLLVGLSILVAIGPILIAMLGGGISELFGQHLTEANAPDIPIIG